MNNPAKCANCRVELPAESLKAHLKSEWHIYNLKRLVASLPILPEDEFLSKKNFLNLSTTKPITNNKWYCSICKKIFASKKSFENHSSSKHILETMISQVSEDQSDPEPAAQLSRDSSSEKDFEEGLPLGSCLFCQRSFSGLPDANEAVKRLLHHMSDVHSFNVPWPQYLRDPVGLLKELGRLVAQEFLCITCGRQFFGRKRGHQPASARAARREALAAVRAHMFDANHRRLFCGTDDPLEMALAIAMAEDRGEDVKSNIPVVARVGGELFAQFYEPVIADKSLVLPGTSDLDYELHLPCGAVLGHRKYFQTVYRQRPPPERSSSEPRQRPQLQHLSRDLLMRVYRPSGALSGAAFKLPLGGCPLSRTEKRLQAREQRTIDRLSLAVGCRGNFFLRGNLRRIF